MVKSVFSLRQLRAGQQATIDHMLGDGDHVHRLAELGLRSGTAIEMFRAGNPCIIRAAGSKLCVRSDHSLDIMVRPGS